MPQGEGMLFLSNQGRPFTTRQMSDLVRERIDAAQIGKRGSCHLFRHTMATLMLENGADLRYVQEMLGHANIEATQIYTRVSISKLKEVHTQTHPGKPIEGLNREGMDSSFFAELEGKVENE
jgi:integrase/recombinase XerD